MRAVIIYMNERKNEREVYTWQKIVDNDLTESSYIDLLQIIKLRI